MSIVLGDREGRVQLTFPAFGGGRPGSGAVQLRAFDEILVGPGQPGQLTGKTRRGELEGLWLDNQVVRPAGTNGLRIVERSSSNEWDYASVDLTAEYGAGLKQFKRHLLYVQPDLFVICDEVSPAQPAAIDIGLWFPRTLQFDSARDEWRVQLAKAGLTARAFGSPRAAWRSWAPSDAADADAVKVAGLRCLRAGVTNKIAELLHLTVLVPHEKDSQRSLAFKLLESETAIGLRVHRDGLPTLIAFRKNQTATEANLTGLQFTGPVAVDVFRPRRK